jgi:hypothetical protein
MQPIEIHPAAAPLVLSGECREILTETQAQAGARILAVAINFRMEIIPIKVEQVSFIGQVVAINGLVLSTAETEALAKSQGFKNSCVMANWAHYWFGGSGLFLVHF